MYIFAEKCNNMESKSSCDRPYTFDRVVRIIITLIFAGLAIWFIRSLSTVLLPFLVAWLVAYILEPFVQFNRRWMRLKGRAVAVFATLIEALIIVVGIVWFVVPSLIEESQKLAGLLSQYSQMGSSVPFVPPVIHDYLRENIDFASIAKSISQQDIKLIFTGIKGLLSGSISIILSVLNWAMSLLYVVFIMLDYDRLVVGFKRLLPVNRRPQVLRLITDVKDSMNIYFRGQALVAFIVGILFSIGFMIVGLPMAIGLGLFIGLLNMVPYLQLVSIIPTAVLCLISTVDGGASFWPMFWGCIVVYVVVQVIQDCILVPRIMGNTMGLNPAIILLSLSIWGSLLGFVGLIIALPMTTLLLSYYNRYRR